MSAIDLGIEKAGAVEGTARARSSGWKGKISIDCKRKVMVLIFYLASFSCSGFCQGRLFPVK
ncbi:hypothetical protein [Rhizobium sp. CNPSo 4039]|uniref:hypothetical protein n=1 Tax=Rhizobium sp. CNPSo 4039 TaxID=3021409 RepID=UPI00254B0B4B|nr:hypothetical protein [Rhizobium sp. CNPSo 4039]MDK4715461.1 hypothetical protein [Rhizobium sp. CNPSo 4039]